MKLATMLNTMYRKDILRNQKYEATKMDIQNAIDDLFEELENDQKQFMETVFLTRDEEKQLDDLVDLAVKTGELNATPVPDDEEQQKELTEAQESINNQLEEESESFAEEQCLSQEQTDDLEKLLAKAQKFGAMCKERDLANPENANSEV